MDPSTQTALTALFGFLPQPFGTYAASAVGIAGIVSLLSGQVARWVKPPSTNSAAWAQTLYHVVTWPAQNFGWARNAVLPGMAPVVQQAARVAAEMTAAAPALAVVAPIAAANGAPVIVPAVPAPTP